jgi:hypothetical protein
VSLTIDEIVGYLTSGFLALEFFPARWSDVCFDYQTVKISNTTLNIRQRLSAVSFGRRRS